METFSPQHWSRCHHAHSNTEEYMPTRWQAGRQAGRQRSKTHAHSQKTPQILHIKKRGNSPSSSLSVWSIKHLVVWMNAHTLLSLFFFYPPSHFCWFGNKVEITIPHKCMLITGFIDLTHALFFRAVTCTKVWSGAKPNGTHTDTHWMFYVMSSGWAQSVALEAQSKTPAREFTVFFFWLIRKQHRENKWWNIFLGSNVKSSSEVIFPCLVRMWSELTDE